MGLMAFRRDSLSLCIIDGSYKNKKCSVIHERFRTWKVAHGVHSVLLTATGKTHCLPEVWDQTGALRNEGN